MKYWHLTLATILLISLPAIALTNLTIVRSSDSQILEANEAMMEGLASDMEARIDMHMRDRASLIASLSEDEDVPYEAMAVIDDFYGGEPASTARDSIASKFSAMSFGSNRGAVIILLDPDYGAIVLAPTRSHLEGYVPLNGSSLEIACLFRVQHFFSTFWTAQVWRFFNSSFFAVHR